MRMTARKQAGAAATRREQMLSARARASVMRARFPDVGQLRIELIFAHPSAHTPSPQRHTLFPSAPAFFRFACPCTDCDGDFDLTTAVTALLDNPTRRKRETAVASGNLRCTGERAPDRAGGGQACSMELQFQLLSGPLSEE